MRHRKPESAPGHGVAAEVLRGAVCFMAAAALLLGLLAASALIPREAIAPRVLASAEALRDAENYEQALEGVRGSTVDRYADSILLNILWHFDEKDPLGSVMRAGYYADPGDPMPRNLYVAVTENPGANQQYIRYWHGSAALVRGLMTFLTLDQIVLWHGIALGALALWLGFRLLRRGETWGAAGLLVGLVGICAWFVPCSLEYAWMFWILLLQLHALVSRRFPTDWGKRRLFFLLSGVCAGFLDFLTTETLTLLVPLLFLLRQDRRSGRETAFRGMMKRGAGAALAWALGYLGMWALKWVVASVVLGENVLPYVTGHIEERLAGDIGLSLPEYVVTGLYRNIRCLFPLEYGTVGVIAGIAIALGAAYWGVTRRRARFCGAWALMCLVVALVPYVRYLILVNHSFMHYFFTYRAQMATLMAAVFILEEVLTAPAASPGRLFPAAGGADDPRKGRRRHP